MISCSGRSRCRARRAFTFIRPAPGSDSREYGIIRGFANRDALAAFRTSPEYLEWNQFALDLTEGSGQVEELCGLESWFTLPGQPLRPLPQWKMALITYIGVDVVTTLLFLTIGPADSKLAVSDPQFRVQRLRRRLSDLDCDAAAYAHFHSWLQPKQEKFQAQKTGHPDFTFYQH